MIMCMSLPVWNAGSSGRKCHRRPHVFQARVHFHSGCTVLRPILCTLCCAVTAHPQVKSPSSPFNPLTLSPAPPPVPCGRTTQLSVCLSWVLPDPSTFFTQPCSPLSSDSWWWTLDCLHLPAAVKNAARSMKVQLSLRGPFLFFGTAGSRGSLLFGGPAALFPQRPHRPPSPVQRTGSSSPTSSPTLALSSSLIEAVRMGVSWSLMVVGFAFP